MVLNGASSAGKTSIARALLPLLQKPTRPEPVCTGLDAVLERLQPFGPERGPAWATALRPLRILAFNLSDGKAKLFRALHQETVTLVQRGQAVIVDATYMEPRYLRCAAEHFAPLDGLLVGVKPPLAVSERWERERGDREIGHARRHYEITHAHGIYDLMLDTSLMTPQEGAAAILERLDNGPAPTAFHQLNTA